jgi:O-antigen ligase
VNSRHIAGLAVWLVVVGLLLFGAAARTTVGRPLYWACGLIGGLALLSALSSLWSGSVELSVIEADRVLAYLGFFLAAFLIAQTTERRQRFAEGLTIAVTLVVILGLCSRLLPDILEVSNGLGTGPRLRYPLGYWNANGAVCGIAVAMLLWSSRRSAWVPLRWISVGLIPAVLLTLYFTYSRGGVLSLLVATGLLLILSRDRLWLFATAAIGLLGAIPAVLAVQSRHDLAENLVSQAAVDQGAIVLLILLGGTALSLALFAALRGLERREHPMTGRAVSMSQSPALLKRLAIAAAVIVVGVTIAVGGRAWDQFSSSDVAFPDNPQAHFSEFSGAGRNEFWRAAIKGFDEAPLFGNGAGTYQFAWEQHRKTALPVHDAHSLYLEAFDELGALGGLLVLAMVGGLLWFGFAAWRDATGRERELCAVLFAAMVAFAVCAAIDWLWEIAAVGAIFFLAAGVLVSVRCSQLAGTSPLARSEMEKRRYGLTLAGVAGAWIVAIALIGPLLGDREIEASQSAAASGDIGSAISHAENARSIEPWAAGPYLQLGLLAELQGDYRGGAEKLTKAIERENGNWLLYYFRSRMRGEALDYGPSAKDLERARKLNPLAPEILAVPE